MFRCLFCLLLISNLLALTSAVGMLGPADFKFIALSECDPPLNDIEINCNLTKFNRTTDLMDIIVKSPFDINERLILELKGSIKKEGGYKPGSFYMKEPACKALTLILGDMFRKILRAAGTEECPLPAGIHKALDFYFDNENFNVFQIYGMYKMEMFLTIDDVLLSCYIFFYEFLPKST